MVCAKQHTFIDKKRTRKGKGDTTMLKSQKIENIKNKTQTGVKRGENTDPSLALEQVRFQNILNSAFT